MRGRRGEGRGGGRGGEGDTERCRETWWEKRVHTLKPFLACSPFHTHKDRHTPYYTHSEESLWTRLGTGPMLCVHVFQSIFPLAPPG